ncbi:MAG: CsgG/HfaB family protein [Planctomycetota bacterium]
MLLHVVVSVSVCLPAKAEIDTTSTNVEVKKLAVMNFDNRNSSGEWQWLSKGLADMIITDLSASERLMIVERERLNDIVAELQLTKAIVVDSSIADQVGRIAKVDWVLFGSFLKEGDHLKIEAHILDLKTQELLRVEWVEGLAEEVLQLEKRLVQQLLERLDIPITEEEKRSIMYVPTDSVSAFEHYSKSLDLYDNGLWFDALLECRLAVRQDANFIKARSRVAELYYEIGKPEHALVEYQDLVKADKDNTFPEHIYYKMGRLLEDRFKDDDAAVILYDKILLRHPEYNTPYDFKQPIEQPGLKRANRPDNAQYPSLRALERLALIHEKKGETFEAAKRFSQIVYFLRKRYLYDIPLGDFKERVWAKYSPIYWEFVRKNHDISLCPPCEVFRIPHNGIADIETGSKEGEKHINYWEDIYCIAPPDREIEELNFNINTNAAFANNDGSMRTIQVACFEPVDYSNHQSRELQSGNAWQRIKFNVKPGVRALIVRAHNTSKWDVTIKCRDWTSNAETHIQGLLYVRLNPEWDEIILDGKYHYKVSSFYTHDGKPTHTYKRQSVAILHPYSGDHVLQICWSDGHRETKRFHVEPKGIVELFFEMPNSDQSFYYEFPQRGSNLNLFVDHRQELWLLWDEAYKNGPSNNPDQESDLFYAISTDGKDWSQPKRLRLSSSSLDMLPIMQQDRSGTYWLVWISSRDSKDPKRLWVASSTNGQKWTFPRKIALPLSEQDVKRARIMNYPSFGFTLDNQDTFWLIWQEKLFNSTDAMEWAEAEALSSASGLDLQPGWNGFGEYSLSHDNTNGLLLVAKHKEKIISSWGTNLGGKIALWRRNNIAKWEFLGFPDEEQIRSCCISANGKNIVALTDKGNDGLLVRTYDNTLGWSKFSKMDNAPNYASNNSIALLHEEQYVVAYCGEKGIVVLSLDNMTFYEEP